MKQKTSSLDAIELNRQFAQRPKIFLRQLGWHTDSPLLWGVDVEAVESHESLRQNHQLLKKKLSAEKAEMFLSVAKQWNHDNEVGRILEIGQIAYSVDQLARTFSTDDLQVLLDRLIQSVEALGALQIKDPWARQLAQVELPLVLAAQSVRPVTNEVAKMEAMIEELVDGDGWIVARYFGHFVPLLSSWARCKRLMEELGIPLEESISLKLEWMTRQWLRSMRPDKTAMLGPERQEPLSKSMQTAILNLSSDREDKKLARLRTQLEKPKVKDESVARLRDGGGFSEWAGAGVFQCGWKSHSPRLALAIEESGLRLEFGNRTSLLRGFWDTRICVNGESVEFDLTNHELNCYHSDEEVEYLEIEYKSKQGVIWQRQILLARDEQFLLLADAILLDEPAKIEYSSTLPIANGINAMCETDNREIYLKDSEIHALAMPLALGEWKSDRMPGGFGASDGTLELEQVVQGKAIYCPLFFDLSPRRCTSPRTWRSLTVAEELKILGQDEAIAFRVQVGDQQWVIYRSLSGIANRTFLGENQICEFYVGSTDGEVPADELIQIE